MISKGYLTTLIENSYKVNDNNQALLLSVLQYNKAIFYLGGGKKTYKHPSYQINL
jgi:hypothetical protein